MITKDRLEELIKEGATIYDKDSHSIDLSKTDSFIENIFEFYYVIEDNRLLKMEKQPHIALNQWWIKDLFETKKQAEWALKYHKTRTEELDLPTWEDFTSTENSIIRFYVKERKYTMYIFVKNKKTNNCRILIRVDNGEQDWLVFEEPATEENYEKACDLCLKLFNGGVEKC